MLSISSIANSNGVPGLGTDFLVASIEILDNTTLRVWFTRPVKNATTSTNFSIQGPASKTVIFAQYETDTKGVRVYLSSVLSVGQWTISFVSGGTGTLLSNDTDSATLPINTKVVFDLVDLSTNDSISETVPLGEVARSIPKKFRDNSVYSGIISGIEAGDSIITEQARAAYDQYFLSSANEKYLTIRARDNGVVRPSKLGIDDELFRTLAINTINRKLTYSAMLSILEIMYGVDSVHAFSETGVAGPYVIFDQGTLDILIDGVQSFQFVSSWGDYQLPLRATAQELSSALNFEFQKNNVKAFSTVARGKVRIYSKTMGVGSSISIQGGTLQPSVQFDSPTFGSIGADVASVFTWTITNPRPHIVRLSPYPAWLMEFSSYLKVKPNDYVTIIGSEFPEELRGSFLVVDVNLTYSAPATPVEWFEIESEFIITPPPSP